MNLWFFWVYLKALSIWINIVYINLKCKCYFWIINSKFDLSALLVFRLSETFRDEIKGIRMRYNDFLTLLSIFKAQSIWIRIVRENGKCESCFWTFNSKLHHLFLVFHTPSEMSKKVIRVKYVDFLTLRRIFKGTVRMT